MPSGYQLFFSDQYKMLQSSNITTTENSHSHPCNIKSNLGLSRVKQLGQKIGCHASLLCSSYRWSKPPSPYLSVYLAEVMSFICGALYASSQHIFKTTTTNELHRALEDKLSHNMALIYSRHTGLDLCGVTKKLCTLTVQSKVFDYN